MTMNQKFEDWWNKENCQDHRGYTTPFQVFQAGWSVGFSEASKTARIQEKLILDELRLHLPEGFDIGKAIVKAVTTGAA